MKDSTTQLLDCGLGNVAEIKLHPSDVAVLSESFFGSPKVIKNTITINGTRIVEDDTVAQMQICGTNAPA